MASLKDEAQAYEPPQTKNIADLDFVDIDIDIKQDKGTTSKGEEFEYKYFELNKEKYRVPNMVLNQIKGILSKFPDTEGVCVIKQGTGKSTTYQTMPAKKPEAKKEVVKDE